MALGLSFEGAGSGLYTGSRACARQDWTPVCARIQSLIGEPTVIPQDHREGWFVLALASDEALRRTRVHADRRAWMALVYLTAPEHCRGGTGWYRHRSTGATCESAVFLESSFGHLAGRPRSELVEAMLSLSCDLAQWVEVQRVGMAFNRCVIFRADQFHAVLETFGDCPENGRLTQVFEFDEAWP